MIKIPDYKEIVEEYGQEFAAALLEEEYNQFIRGNGRAPADFYPFDCSDDYIDFIETIGYRRVKANHEKLYRMEEGI